VSGAVAERCKFEGYLAYAVLLTSWVYPVVVHCAILSLALEGFLKVFSFKLSASD
jgi:ammonia channel protein AmtB